MSAVKERILGAITVMSEEEIAIINAYEDNHENYQPYITHEELKKELNL